MNYFAELREWHASLPRPSWSDLLLRYMRDFWADTRRHAERPERQVPYY